MSSQIVAQLGALKTRYFPHGIAPQWITIEQQTVTLRLPFLLSQQGLHEVIEAAGLSDWQWQLAPQIERLRNSQPELPMRTGNVIVVSSGKGGVGKSSVTVSLAIALQQLGARVGIIDADIYGPSIPTMLGRASDSLQFTSRNKMIPQQVHDLQVNSLGYLVADKDATIWRGPMASAALQQLFKDTDWPQLDYLLVDMPPGTGDIQLTMAQKLPVTGALVVTTPQTVALADAQKGIAMFNKLDIPLLGVLENMSVYQCPSCGHQEAIFGDSGGAQVAAEQGVPLLGQWPLFAPLRESLDQGVPYNRQHADSAIAAQMRDSAAFLTANLYYQRHDRV